MQTSTETVKYYEDKTYNIKEYLVAECDRDHWNESTGRNEIVHAYGRLVSQYDAVILAASAYWEGRFGNYYITIFGVDEDGDIVEEYKGWESFLKDPETKAIIENTAGATEVDLYAYGDSYLIEVDGIRYAIPDAVAHSKAPDSTFLGDARGIYNYWWHPIQNDADWDIVVVPDEEMTLLCTFDVENDHMELTEDFAKSHASSLPYFQHDL